MMYPVVIELKSNAFSEVCDAIAKWTAENPDKAKWQIIDTHFVNNKKLGKIGLVVLLDEPTI